MASGVGKKLHKIATIRGWTLGVFNMTKKKAKGEVTLICNGLRRPAAQIVNELLLATTKIPVRKHQRHIRGRALHIYKLSKTDNHEVVLAQISKAEKLLKQVNNRWGEKGLQKKMRKDIKALPEDIKQGKSVEELQQIVREKRKERSIYFRWLKGKKDKHLDDLVKMARDFDGNLGKWVVIDKSSENKNAIYWHGMPYRLRKYYVENFTIEGTNKENMDEVDEEIDGIDETDDEMEEMDEDINHEDTDNE